jgi:5-methyltetrahydrofolate--homocysteine methyltransferase
MFQPSRIAKRIWEYDETPEQMQAFIKEYLDDNLVNIIGGCCCTTTPEHIKLIAEIAKDYKPRVSTANNVKTRCIRV